MKTGTGGFTLVELAAVLVITGLLALMASGVTRSYYSQRANRTTLDNMRILEAALIQFMGNEGRYPCPADPSLPQNNPGYGRELCRPLPLPLDCAGVPAGLECNTIGSRDANGDGLNDVVMIGMLPVRDIYDSVNEDVMFREFHSLDGYGLRLTYAVTESMTNEANDAVNPVNNNLGAIRVEDANAVSLTDPDSSAHFVLVSHGENGKGAYSQSGTEVDGCNVLVGGVPTPLPAGPLGGGIDPEKENCDRNDSIFIDDIKSMNINNNRYYDDVVFFRVGGFQPLWVQSLSSPNGRVWVNNTNPGNVAIGPGLTDATQALHVFGDVSAETDVRAQGYCGLTGPDAGGNPANDDCMFAETIGGVGTQCPDGTHAAYGIEDNQLRCRQVIPSPAAFAGKTCAAGTYLVGISNLGNIECATP